MFGTSGDELLRKIDPHLSWKTCSRVRSRAPRRPRTCFLADSKKKFQAKHSIENELSTDRDPKSKELSVYESEKLGVTILGHRFDGSLEGVPIKKRIRLAHSPSSSRASPPSSSEITDNVLGSPKLHNLNRRPEHTVRFSAPYDAADFSGISILADAACSDRIGGENMDSEASVSKDAPFDCHQKGSSVIGSPDEELSDGRIADIKADTSEHSVSVRVLSPIENGSCNGDAPLLDENTSSFDDGHIDGVKVSNMEKASKKAKFHWDLNKEMDAWDLPDDDDVDVNDVSNHDVCNKVFDKEVHIDPVRDCVELVNEVSQDNDALVGMGVPAEAKIHHSCNEIENVTFPLTQQSSCQIAGDSSNIEELIPNNSIQNFVTTGLAVDVLSNPLPVSGVITTPCMTVDEPCLSHAPAEEIDGSTEILSQIICMKPANTLLSACPVIVCASVEVATQHEICNDEYSQNADHTDILCNDVAQERNLDDYVLKSVPVESDDLKDEVLNSIPIELPACGSVSSAKLILYANQDKIEKMGADHQHVKDAESSQSDELHGASGKPDNDSNIILMEPCDEDNAMDQNDLACAFSANDIGMMANEVGCNVTSKSLTEAEQIENTLGGCPSGHLDGMNIVDFHRDDDSQYEDGEVRESVLHDWGLDDGDYDDDEDVDYGSDERESYLIEDVCDNPASPIPADSRSSEKIVETLSENRCINPASNQVSKMGLETKWQKNSAYSNIEVIRRNANCSEEQQVRRKVGNGGMDRSNRDTACCAIVKDGYSDECSKDGDCLKKPGRSVFLKMNSLGSNQLHVESECTADSDIGLHLDGEVKDASGAAKTGESHKKVPDLKLSRDVLSQIGRDRPSEFSNSTDGTCHPGNRVNRDGTNHATKMDRTPTVFLHKQESRSKVYSSSETFDQWNPNQRGKLRYHSSAGYVQPVRKNAAGNPAAKVESNGYAASPDGTAVEPGPLEANGWTSKRNASTFARAPFTSLTRLHSTGRDRSSRNERDDTLAFSSRSERHRISREVSSERHTSDGEGSYRHGLRSFSAARKEKYSMHVSGDRIDSLPSHRAISHKGRSPPPRESSLTRRRGRSRSRSQSRSRTRSPHAWMSPTRNDGGRIMGHHGFRRDRPPSDFRCNGRLEPLKLPYRRSSYADRLDFIPPFRGQLSPPSRSIQERNDVESNLRRRGYNICRQPSERSPPDRPFSRSDRLGLLDARRMDEEEYYRHIHPGRHQEFVGAGKRSRFDEYDDRRDHGTRFEMLFSPSSRQYAPAEMKRFRYNDVDECRFERSRLKNDQDFDDRDSLRGFLGGSVDQLESPPHRSTGDRGHFRYGREVRHGANPKSAGLQECVKDVKLMRRRLS